MAAMSTGVLSRLGRSVLRRGRLLLLLPALLDGLGAQAPAEPAALPPIARLQGIDLLSLSNQSQVFFRFDWAVEYRVLRDPVMNTLSLDLQNVRLVPTLNPHPQAKAFDRFLKGVQLTQVSPTTVRVDFDLKGPSGFAYSIESEPPKLLVEFRPGTTVPETKRNQARRSSTEAQPAPRTAPSIPAVRTEPPAPAPTPASASASASASAPASAPAPPVASKSAVADATPPQAGPPRPSSEAAGTPELLVGIRDIQVVGGQDFDRVVIRADGPFTFERRRLTHPNRLYFDLRATRLAPQVRRRLTVDSPRLLRVRTAQNRPGVVRVVLDLPEGVLHRTEMLDESGQLIVTVLLPR